jgi:hypothetical protein
MRPQSNWCYENLKISHRKFIWLISKLTKGRKYFGISKENLRPPLLYSFHTKALISWEWSHGDTFASGVCRFSVLLHKTTLLRSNSIENVSVGGPEQLSWKQINRQSQVYSYFVDNTVLKITWKWTILLFFADFITVAKWLSRLPKWNFTHYHLVFYTVKVLCVFTKSKNILRHLIQVEKAELRDL